MKYTNKFNLPKIIIDASYNDRYSRGDSRISVTQLIDSPRISVLREQNHDNMEMDVSDRIWALLGTAVHKIVEEHREVNEIVEERIFAEIGGWKISGAIDRQIIDGDKCRLIDWKCTSIYSVMPGANQIQSWAKQLNCYAELVYITKGYFVSGLQVCAVLRDWSRTKAKTDKSYPKSPIIMVDIPLWTPAYRQKYLDSRVRVHQNAQIDIELGELTGCTDEERWARPEQWAVLKKGNKRATRVFDSKEDAEIFIKDNPPKSGTYTIDHRKGEYARCEGDFCGVARWCEQWQGEKNAKS